MGLPSKKLFLVLEKWLKRPPEQPPVFDIGQLVSRIYPPAAYELDSIITRVEIPGGYRSDAVRDCMYGTSITDRNSKYSGVKRPTGCSWPHFSVYHLSTFLPSDSRIAISRCHSHPMALLCSFRCRVCRLQDKDQTGIVTIALMNKDCILRSPLTALGYTTAQCADGRAIIAMGRPSVYMSSNSVGLGQNQTSIDYP
jgi:hypothetical protein